MLRDCLAGLGLSLLAICGCANADPAKEGDTTGTQDAGSSSEDEEASAPVAAWRPPDLAQLQADDDESDDETGGEA